MSKRKKSRARAAQIKTDPPQDNSAGGLRLGRIAVVGIGAALVICTAIAILAPPDDDANTAAAPAPSAAPAEPPQATIDIPEKPADVNSAALRAELLALGDQLTEQLPQSAEALHVKALLYLDLQKAKDAASIWRQCIELAPQQAGPYVGLARAAMELGDDQLAVDTIHRAREAGCSSAELDHQLAAALTKLGRLDEAEQTLLTSLASLPGDAQNRLQLGQVQSQLGNFAEAEANLKQAIELGAADPSVYFTLSTVCVRQGKMEKAAEYRHIFSERKTRAAADDVQFQQDYDTEFRRIAVATTCRAAAVYAHQGDQQQAERLYLRALELAPASAVVCGELANFYRKHNRLADAARLQQHLVEFEPANVFHYINLANLSSQLGDLESAENVLKKSIQVRPDAAIGYTALAQLCLQQGRTGQARSYAEAALRRRAAPQETVNAYLLLASACEQLGDRETARAALSAAREMAPNDPRLPAAASEK